MVDVLTFEHMTVFEITFSLMISFGHVLTVRRLSRLPAIFSER